MSTRRRLPQLLLASHVSPVLVLAALLLATGVGTLRSAVVGQARTEADRAVSEARRRLQEWDRDLSVGADLLAEQPTLRFYLARGQFTKARDLVKAFHDTSDVEYILVQWRGRTIAEIGRVPPTFATGLAFDASRQAWRVYQRDVQGLPDATIVVAERLGDRLAVRPATDQIRVELRPPVLGLPARNDAWQTALREVSTGGEAESFEGVGDSAAARIALYRDEGSRADVLLTARIADDWIRRRVFESFAAFGLTSLLTAILALGLAAWLAARIARPFEQLARDAERLGRGDLQTPVQPVQTILVEASALATSLEDMRRRVGTLTTTERSQRDQLDAVLDGVDEGIVGIEPDRRIHYANRQFLALVGRTREQVLGQRADDLLQPISNVGAEAGAGEARGLPAPERCTPAGMMRPLAVRRLPASDGRQVWVLREENAIEAARAMRDSILANLSHEFQTPLSAQIASIELLRDHLRGSGDDDAIRLADAQYRGTIRLSQLVDNLLESVRIESGEMRLRRQPVDLPAVIAEAIELIQPLTAQREQTILAELPPGPLLTGDPPRLASVMVNLLANANKFAPDRTTIWVELEWQADAAIVWVEDEGPGLPSLGAGGDLFAPFKRAPHEEPSQRGTGLGLAIVHAIVLAHGGEVRVAPPLHRSGARIGIVLPRERNE